MNHKAHMPYLWIVGSLGFILVVIVIGIVLYVCLRSSSCCAEARRGHSKDPDGQIRFHVLRNPSFCCASGRFICCKSADWKQTNGDSSNQEIAIPKGLLSEFYYCFMRPKLDLLLPESQFNMKLCFSKCLMSIPYVGKRETRR